ncbi:FKFBP [Symbiodinium necroappetens]|uniref:FKFBP protein n=2 Tax=Symbiodinium TaxID=2949 RepID=A0A812YXJ2_9DINO|nr:FKFBP [Symbiodinium necroappetens]
MPERSGRSEFFDNHNPDSVAAREKMAMTALADAIRFLDEGGKFAIFDATNSTVARRQSIAEQVTRAS